MILSKIFIINLCCQVDVRGVLQQIPSSPSRASESAAGQGLVQTDPAAAHPRLRPVLLRKNQSFFPGWSGGSSGEVESREAACGCCDHSEPGPRMAGKDQIHQVPLGNCHRTEILQRSTGQTVRIERDMSVTEREESIWYTSWYIFIYF